MIKELSLSIGQLLGISTTIASLIAICICAVWSIIFNRIKEGQKAEFQKQIEQQKSEFTKEVENLKAKNEKINYITKTQFDAEFKMYQELSKYCFEMILKTSSLYPMGIDYLPENDEQRNEVYRERYLNAKETLITFQNTLYQYAPFILKELYSLFDDLKKECQKQVNMYLDCKVNPDKDADVRKEYRVMEIDCWKRTPNIYKKHEDIIAKLRDYLCTLKVQEEYR